MTLSFSTKWPERMGEFAGQPNCFTNKIMKSMWLHYGKQTTDFVLDRSEHEKKRFEDIDPFEPLTVYENQCLYPKLHTIREDKNDRWKAGNDIHMVINNRTKDRFQFAPVVKCVSVQEIEISCKSNWWMEDIPCWVGVDGYDLTDDEIKTLAINDGFPSVEAFFQFFDKDFNGKIISWVYVKY